MEICKAPTPAAQSAEQAKYNTHGVHPDGKDISNKRVCKEEGKANT